MQIHPFTAPALAALALPSAAQTQPGEVLAEQKISAVEGGLSVSGTSFGGGPGDRDPAVTRQARPGRRA